MLRRIIVCSICVVMFAALAPACVEEDDARVTATEEADVIGSCNTDCDCAVGSACVGGGALRACKPIPITGNIWGGPLCGATCQCGYGQTCTRGNADVGSCRPGGNACVTSCDCPHGTVCSAGTCTADFGPYPECHCNSQCGAGEICTNGLCAFGGSGGGGGGGPGGGGPGGGGGGGGGGELP